MQNRALRGVVGVLAVMVTAAGCATQDWNPPRAYAQAGAAMSPEAVVLAGERFESGKLVAATGPEESTNATDRLMTYDATLRVVVQDVSGSLAALQKMAASLKGYMQSMSESSIILRIPGVQLNEAIRQVEKVGEVASREIKGTDVTEEMRDLDIRLRNMQEMRDRLVKLMDKGDKVEDLLKVEKELERVTESLELLKGRIQYLSHAVAYSTLTVLLNSPVPQTELRDVIPFPWVRNLATDVVLRPEASFDPERHWFSWLKMDLPPSYVKLAEESGWTRAMSGNGVMLMIQRERNFKEGTVAFWTPIVRRWLLGSKVIAIGETQNVTLGTGAPGFSLSGTKTIGRKTYQYMLLTIVGRKYLYTCECWGPAEDVAKDREAIDKAFRSAWFDP